MTMKFVYPNRCHNNSNFGTSYLRKSLILCQTFTKEDAKENHGKDIFVQKKVFSVPNQFQIFLSVKIEMDPYEWNRLSPDRRRVVWSKSRSQLYWSCDNSINSLSLCNSSGILTTASLTIDIYDAVTTLHYLQCSICFLTESNEEYLNHYPKNSFHIERVVFKLHQYLPQHLSNRQSAVQLQITRTDRIPGENEIGKIFITNVSLTDINNNDENTMSNNNCQFYCGWGPNCLRQIRDVCNRKFNCVYGEDEDKRLCKAIADGIISIKYDFQSTLSPYDHEKSISPLSSIIKTYLIVIICVGILLGLFIFVGWFMCRNCEMADNHFNNSARKFNSTIVTPDSDTSCSTCEMKLKLNSLEFARRNQRPHSAEHSKFLTKTSMVDFEIPRFNRRNTYFTTMTSNSQNFTNRESLKQLCHNTRDDSNKNRAVQSSEWLNLFFHVSTEARHKSLVKQPPPNVNKSNNDIAVNKNINKFSVTPLTCVFLVMI